MDRNEPAIRVVDLSKRHFIGRRRRMRSLRDALAGLLQPGQRTPREPDEGWIWALRNLDLEVARGEAVGIIGRNGAGKSTLLRILSRISAPTSGYAELRGSVASLLEVGTGFHPELTGRENVYLNGAVLGMRRAEISRKFDEIVDFAEVSGFLDTPVKRYSSGMRMRLAFAVAAHLEADVLMVDEVLAVGDVGFRNKCLGKMGEVARDGRTVLFVSHSMPAVETLCPRVILLDEGRVVGSGPASDVIARYYALNGSRTRRSEGPVGRSADGHVEIGTIEALSAGGEPLPMLHTGRDFVIRFRVRAERPLRRAVFVITLHDALGSKVAAFSSRTSGRELDLPEGESVVHCVAHDPPFAPGVYDADLRFDLGMENLLFRRSVATFHVGESDYFKSGGLPGECASARCLVRQSWSVERE